MEPYQIFSELMQLYHGVYKQNYTNFAGASVPLSVFPNPRCLKDALIKSVNEDHAGYISPLGTYEMRELIANYENTRIGRNVCNLHDVGVMPGSATGIIGYVLDQIFKDQRGELIISAPNYWMPFEYMKRKLPKVKMSKINTLSQNGFLPIAEQIADKISEKTKALFLCNPLNPTGRSLNEIELEKIVVLAKKYGTHIICDEACYDLRYQGSAPSLAGFGYDNISIVRTWSKDRGRPDMNLGYLISDPEMLKERQEGVIYDDPGRFFSEFIKVDMIMRTRMIQESPNFKDVRDLELFEDYENTVNSNLAKFKKNTDYAIECLKKISCIENIIQPEGGFTIFFSLNHPKVNSDIVFAKDLFESTGVTTLPGKAFGMNDDGSVWIRLSIACDFEKTEEETLKAPKTYLVDGIKKMVDYLKEL